MAPTLRAAALEIPRKSIAAKLRFDGETERKEIAEPGRCMLGRAINHALAAVEMSKLDAARACRYGDNAAPISRWIGGVENAPVGLLLECLGTAWGLHFGIALMREVASRVDESIVHRSSAIRIDWNRVPDWRTEVRW